MKPSVWIASHRGHFGGNVVENTLPAFEAAVRCGADIVETDIRKTKDHVMILFHDPSPERLLGLPGNVEDYTLEELRARPLRNAIGFDSDSRVNTLTELLDALKGRCMINLDQCWGMMDEVYDLLESKGMEEQALIKGRVPYDEVLRWIKSRDYVPKFIPILTCPEDLPAFRGLPPELQIPMVEVFLTHEEEELISPAFVEEVQKKGARLWVNALSLGNGIEMAAGHNDDVSILRSPEDGWGWLIRHGVGVIQTDWPSELKQYLTAFEE